MNKKTKTKNKIEVEGVEIKKEEMAEAGVNLGHKTSKLYPTMEEYIVGISNTIHVIDLKKTIELLKEALSYISKLAKADKQILFVGTKTPLKELVEEIAEGVDQPFVTERWLGGTFTNFEVISERVDHLKKMEKKEEEGEFEKYTKKEKAEKGQELKDLRRRFGGLKKMESLPKAVFITDVVEDNIALREAKQKDIDIIAIVDTNADISEVDYPIPANDDAITSVRYILEKVKEVIKQAKK